MRIAALLALGLAAMAEHGEAQQRGAPRKPWNFDFDISVANSSGNQTLSLWNTSTRFRYRKQDLFETDLRLRVRFAERQVDDERQKVQEIYTANFRLDLGQVSGLGPFIETQAQHDPLRELNLRLNTGAGMRYSERRQDRSGDASFRVSLSHDYEDRKDRDVRKTGRWTFQLEGRQTVADNVEIRHSSRFRPLHDHMDEYLLNLDTRVTVRVTERVGLNIRHEFDRNSHPPRRAPHRDDRTLTAGVTVRL